MIETFSGNHMAQRAEKDYQARSTTCACGKDNWAEIQVCEHNKTLECDHLKCNGGGAYKQQYGCNSITAYACENCGFVEVPE